MGIVRTYDLDRHWLTGYSIPNLWLEHEAKLKRSGITDRIDIKCPMVMDLVIHPRNLNLIFIVYEMGVVLWDIANRAALRTFELTLHPGAPGGGCYDEDVLYTERQVRATSISIHPSGHFFSIGHIDGCISFWAVEDNDRPLAVRTPGDPFSVVDVHVPDPLALIDTDEPTAKPELREPIFKLAWCGFGNQDSSSMSSHSKAEHGFGELNDTTLVALGGTTPSEGGGITCLTFPPLVVPHLGGSTGAGLQDDLQPAHRLAFKNSLFPPQQSSEVSTDSGENIGDPACCRYITGDVIEDFLLTPSGSPHMNGTFDPTGIITLSSTSSNNESVRGRKDILQAFQFPPSSRQLAQQQSRLPISLMFDFPSPKNMIIGAQIHKFDSRELFGRVVDGWVNYGDNGQSVLGQRLTALKAGGAWSNLTVEGAPSAKLSKFDYHRLLITHHADLTIRFFDASPQLLISTDLLKFEYPQILPYLTIEVHRALTHLTSKRTLQEPVRSYIIQSVEFAKVALEVAVVLGSGDVLVYRFKEGGSPTQVFDIPIEDQKMIVSLDPVLTASDRRRDSFHPFFLIHGNARVTSCALSDVGFLAIADDAHSILLINLRGPCIVWRETWSKDRKDKLGTIECMSWTISPGLGSDMRPGIHLIATHQGGMSRVITLDQNTGTKKWEVIERPADAASGLRSTGLTDPLYSVVVDAKSGNELTASPTALQRALAGNLEEITVRSDGTSVKVHCFWVIASKRGARCFLNITDDRVGWTDWPKGTGVALEAKVVNRNGYQVLAVFMEGEKALIYSLPELELLHTILLTDTHTNQNVKISCDSEGDFVKLIPGNTRASVTLETLFNFRRPLPSLVDFGEPPIPPVAAQPQPVPLTSGDQGVIGALGTWVWGGTTKLKTGDEMDTILAGPERPPPIVPQVQKSSKPSVVIEERTSRAEKRGSASRSDLSSRLQSAAAERGEALSNLEERFASMETNSRDMAQNAKRVAMQMGAKQGVKRWFSGIGG